MAITQIPAEFIPVNAISGTIIADNAVTAVHIATNAISGTLIADNAVTAVHIATNAISGTLIADNAITAIHISGNSVTAALLQDNAVGTDQLAGIARGKIIYGDSNGDPQLLTVGSNGQILKSDGSDISWGSESNAITALNNATENELVTIGSTTTELNAESGLTWDTTTLTVNGAAVFNESGSDVDFRIESDDNANMFFVDGGNDRVGIGTGTPVHPLQVNADNDGIMINNSGQTNGEFAALYFTSHNVAAPYPKMAIASKRTGDYGIGDMYFAVDSTGDEADVNIDSDAKMVIKNNGNVGIGTTSPGDILELDGTNPILKIGNRIRIKADESNADAWFGIGSSLNTIKFGDADFTAPYVTIKGATGKVGIGTASPATMLHINHATDVATRWSTTSGSAYSFQIGQYYTTWQTLAHPNIWQPIDGSGSSDICITTATNNVKKGMIFDASNGGSVSIGGAESVGISGYAKTLKITSSEGRFLRLHASDAGGDPDFRVTGESGSGSMWVGHMAGSGILDLYAGGAVRFRIAANGDLTGTDTSISSISDSRLKENIESYTYDINKFKNYSPKRFDWKNPEQHGDKSQQLGFISQDLESIDTRWVGETKLQDNPEDGYTNPDLALVEADKISKTSSFGPKDAMYISIIQQMITRIEALEE